MVTCSWRKGQDSRCYRTRVVRSSASRAGMASHQEVWDRGAGIRGPGRVTRPDRTFNPFYRHASWAAALRRSPCGSYRNAWSLIPCTTSWGTTRAGAAPAARDGFSPQVGRVRGGQAAGDTAHMRPPFTGQGPPVPYPAWGVTARNRSTCSCGGPAQAGPAGRAGVLVGRTGRVGGGLRVPVSSAPVSGLQADAGLAARIPKLVTTPKRG